MSDTELLFGLSSGNFNSQGSPMNDGSENSGIARRQLIETIIPDSDMHTIQMEIETLTREKIDSHLVDSWSSSLHKETLSIAPANTPVLSPRRSNYDHSSSETDSVIENIHYMKQSVNNDDFLHRDFFNDANHNLDSLYSQSKPCANTVVDALEKFRYKDNSADLTSKCLNIFSSSPFKKRNQSINTSIISSNYTHRNTSVDVILQPTFLRQVTFDDSCAPGTTLIDNCFEQTDPEFNINAGSPKSQQREMNNLTTKYVRSNEIILENITGNTSERSLNMGYILDGITSSQKSFNLSSSPFPSLETKFSEPRPITEVFQLEENDIIDKNSKHTQVESFKNAPYPKLESTKSSRTCLEDRFSNTTFTSKTPLTPQLNDVSKNALFSAFAVSTKQFLRPKVKLAHETGSKIKVVNNRHKKTHGLEIDPQNIIPLVNQTGRALRKSTVGKNLNEDGLFEKLVCNKDPRKDWRGYKNGKSLPRTHHASNVYQFESSSRSKNGCWTCRYVAKIVYLMTFRAAKTNELTNETEFEKKNVQKRNHSVNSA